MTSGRLSQAAAVWPSASLENRRAAKPAWIHLQKYAKAFFGVCVSANQTANKRESWEDPSAGSECQASIDVTYTGTTGTSRRHDKVVLPRTMTGHTLIPGYATSLAEMLRSQFTLGCTLKCAFTVLDAQVL